MLEEEINAIEADIEEHVKHTSRAKTEVNLRRKAVAFDKMNLQTKYFYSQAQEVSDDAKDSIAYEKKFLCTKIIHVDAWRKQ